MDEAILHFFEGIRSPALTAIFGIFSTLGEGAVVAGAVILLYWLWGRAGEQLLFTAISSAAVNSGLKNMIHRPRPYAAGVVSLLEVDTPVFSTLNLGDNLSFPSGHTQASSSALFGGAVRLKKVWLWILSPILVLLIMCSRLYFGVHYPTDVLAGLGFGVLFALLWQLVFRYAYSFRFYVLAALAIAAIVLIAFYPEKEYVQMTALLAGGAVFLPLVSFLKCDPPKSVQRRLLRIPVGIACAGAVFGLTLLFPAGLAETFLKWFLLFGAATLGANALFKVFKI